jgi:hypothetical protein
MPLTAGLVLSAVGSGLKAYQGYQQNNDGEKLAAGNKRPLYNIPQEYYNNQSLTENQAQSGLGAPALNYAARTNDRGLSAGIDATLQAGGSPNNLAKLYDTYDVNGARTAAEDNQLRTAHLQQLIDANKDLGGQETQKWALNEYEPYKDTARLASQEKSDGTKNMFGAVSDFGSALSTYAAAQNNADDGTSKPTKAPPIAATAPTLDMGGFNMTPLSQPPANIFQTPGGNNAMNQMAQSNPNSPYMAALLNALNRPQ